MAEFFPEWRGGTKERITLRDVLSMASGLKWDEDYTPDDVSDIIQMVVLERDHLSYAASRPILSPPGVDFSYSSGDSMLLSGVIEAVTGHAAGDYAREKLFDPIGMGPVDWWRDAEGHTATYCCVDAPTREFARFGLLYLRGGEWEGRQIVPANWVAESTSPNRLWDQYGYLWWLTGRGSSSLPEDLFSARGLDDQYIYVIPSLDLVVVRNGHYDKYDGEPRAQPSLFELYPSGGLVPGRGTMPVMGRWDDADFLKPVLSSLE